MSRNGKEEKTGRRDFAAVALFLLPMLGCAGSDANFAYYQAPASDAHDSAATISGSMKQQRYVLYTERASVSSIDGKAIRRPQYGVHEPIRVTVGPHVVHVTCRQGRWLGTAEFKLELAPGGEYAIRCRIDKDSLGMYQGQALLWIEDSKTQDPVTDKVLSDITSPEIEFRQAIQPTLPVSPAMTR